MRMSRENVELMRELWPAELDMVELATNGPPQDMVELLDAGLEVVFKSNLPGVPPLVYHGSDGLAAGWREWGCRSRATSCSRASSSTLATTSS